MSTAPDISLHSLTADLPRVGGRKSELVYTALKRAILFRQLVPDQQLLEQELAAVFGCSQGTIREALLRLADDGLVRRMGYRGTRVTETSLEEAVEMVRVRLTIERGVARKIAVAEMGPHRERMEALLARMVQAHAQDDLFLGAELDREFHCALASAAEMDLLCPVLLRCTLHIHRFTLSSIEVPRQYYQEAGVDAEHQALFEALTCGDPDRAERVISEHIAHVLERWAPSVYDAIGPSLFASLR